MKIALLSISLVVLLICSGFSSSSVRASPWPVLPSSVVVIRLMNGTTSYYDATLGGVPQGLDVANGVYADWCVDRRSVAVRGINTQVLLYSSLTPPSNLTSQRWDMVNYILNHKRGSMKDVQAAIWYFVKMSGVGWWTGYTPTANANATVNDAQTNGTGFTPGPGQLLAVIAIPLTTQIQITVIEVHQSLAPINYTVGGYSYSIQSTNRSDYLVPSICSVVFLAMFLIVLKNKKKSLLG